MATTSYPVDNAPPLAGTEHSVAVSFTASALPYVVDFSSFSSGNYTFWPQGGYVDNSLGTADVVITILPINFSVTVTAGQKGSVSWPAVNKQRASITGGGDVIIYFANYELVPDGVSVGSVTATIPSPMVVTAPTTAPVAVIGDPTNPVPITAPSTAPVPVLVDPTTAIVVSAPSTAPVPVLVDPTNPVVVSASSAAPVTVVRPVRGVVTTLLNAVAVTGAGSWIAVPTIPAAIQATVTDTAAVTATIDIEVSNDGVNAVSTAPITISLSGATTDSDGGILNAPWKYVRANLSVLTGTTPSVTVLMGT